MNTGGAVAAAAAIRSRTSESKLRVELRGVTFAQKVTVLCETRNSEAKIRQRFRSATIGRNGGFSGGSHSAYSYVFDTKLRPQVIPVRPVQKVAAIVEKRNFDAKLRL